MDEMKYSTYGKINRVPQASLRESYFGDAHSDAFFFTVVKI